MNAPAAHSANPTQSVLKALDQCVVCGLCIPHCPTYPISQKEGDSPRGRISLMQGILNGQLTDIEHADTALSGCLGCRACETVCPAQVPYGAALAEFKLVRPAGPWKKTPWLIRRIKNHSASIRLLQWAARALLLIPGVSRSNATMARLARSAYGNPTPAQGRTTARATSGSVLLFPGCVIPGLAPEIVDAARSVLAVMGYSAIEPRKSACCGALNLSEGDADGLRRHIGAMSTFANTDNTLPIVSLATGCSSQMSLYPAISALADCDTLWASRVTDILEFIDVALAKNAIKFKPSSLRIAIHEPCSVRHGLKKSGITQRLIERIPSTEITTLGKNFPCCGAGGATMLLHPKMTDKLAGDTADALLACKPDVIVSANIGCAMHLRAELIRRGSPIAVRHPIEILAQHLTT